LLKKDCSLATVVVVLVVLPVVWMGERMSFVLSVCATLYEYCQ